MPDNNNSTPDVAQIFRDKLTFQQVRVIAATTNRFVPPSMEVAKEIYPEAFAAADASGITTHELKAIVLSLSTPAE